MLSPSADTIRLFLHTLSAAVWVGGQITVGGIVPALRRTHPAATKVVARAFGRVAWPAFAMLTITGMWSLMDEQLTDMSSAYQVTVLVKIAVAILAGVAAGVHSVGASKLAVALGGALAAVASIAALFLGVLLAG